MARQAADTRHAADANQSTTPTLSHGRDERLESRSHANVIDGEGACHDVNVFPLGRIHADADARVGNDNIRHALAFQASLPGGHEGHGFRHICTINFVAGRGYSMGASPCFYRISPPRRQR